MKFSEYKPKTFSESLFSLEGISKKAITDHLKLYQGYVNKYNEINKTLISLAREDYIKANQVYSPIRELKVELSFAWGGIINHEIYFDHLEKNKGTTSSTPSDVLLRQIGTDFESYDRYIADLKATAMSARGWMWTVWNHREKRLINYIGDSQNTYSSWFSTPILALDTYEHAYFYDFGTDRGKYIDVFLQNLNWDKVLGNFIKIEKT